MGKILIIIFILLVASGLAFSLVPQAFSHQSGCHRWHSCPSDSGSYTCGDTGYCSACPDNQYCKNGSPKIQTYTNIPLPEISISAETDQDLYENGDVISISGRIWPEAETSVFLTIRNPQGQTIWTEQVDTRDTGKFSTLAIAGGNDWIKDGTYRLDVSYKGELAFVYFDFHAPESKVAEIVPGWIKNNAKWWADGQIGDDDFVSGIEFMMKEKIINIPTLPTQASSQAEEKVPDWVRNNAGWWAAGQISENDFVNGIEYLVKVGIINLQNKTPTYTSPTSTEALLSVVISNNSYEEGETIVISGKVSTILLETPVTIQIFNLGNLIEISQLVVAQDGSFTHTILAQGAQWQNEGDYTVRASYGEGSIAETNFEFFKKPISGDTSDFFEVDAGGRGTFDVEYTIRGGTVKDMIVDSNLFALIVTIESTGDGSITVDLPRESIDAKKSDGSDDIFIILIDGIEVIYDEAITNENTRTLTIQFEEGDSDIQIMGTFVI